MPETNGVATDPTQQSGQEIAELKQQIKELQWCVAEQAHKHDEFVFGLKVAAAQAQLAEARKLLDDPRTKELLTQQLVKQMSLARPGLIEGQSEAAPL